MKQNQAYIKKYFLVWLSCISLILLMNSFQPRTLNVFNIRDYGAIGDSLFLNTKAIQKTIDVCAQQGGGVVIVPAEISLPAVYRTGTIILKSNVTIEIQKGAVLLGSINYEDYATIEPFIDGVNATRGACLIGAKDENNISITGEGIINGQGQHWRRENNAAFDKRPFLIRFIRSKNIVLKNIQLKSSAAWMCNLDLCEGVVIDNINIVNHVNANNDGIDIDACNKVSIQNCTISSSDDAICFKSTRGDNPCQNVTVENNTLQSNCGALKWGTESMGDFKNFNVNNNYIHDTKLCGIKILSADGANNSHIEIRNTTMKNVICPIMIALESRLRSYHDYPRKMTGTIKNILIDGVTASDCKSIGIFITGIPGQYIGNDIKIQNVEFSGLGGSNDPLDSAVQVKEIIDGYPEYKNFGKIPAYAAFIRHTKGIELRNIKITQSKSDVRYVVVLDDVKGAANWENVIHNFTIENKELSPLQLKWVNRYQ